MKSTYSSYAQAAGPPAQAAGPLAQAAGPLAQAAGPLAQAPGPLVVSASDELVQALVVENSTVQLCKMGFGRQFAKCLVNNAVSTVHQESTEPKMIIGVRSFGRPERALNTLRLLETALTDTHLAVTYLFLEDPTSYNEVLAGTMWTDRVRQGAKGADGQVACIEEIAGVGCRVVILDDNLSFFLKCESAGGLKVKGVRLQDRGYLSAIISRGFDSLTRGGTRIWGLNQCSNFRQMPVPAERHGPGLVYGACFGFLASGDPSLRSKHGQVKDDLERSLRYMSKCDGKITRLMEYAVVKKDRPGVFKTSKGGISQSLGSEEQHRLEGQEALRKLYAEFEHYLTWPKATCKKPPPLGVFFKRRSGPASSSTCPQAMDEISDDELDSTSDAADGNSATRRGN